METFLSIQGEGYHQGLLSYFIRISGCDVGCPWCDVKDSWEVDENQWRDVNDLAEEAAQSGASNVIITGGEPLMYDLSELTEALSSRALKLHLETSGAYPLSGQFDWITLSPKKFKEPIGDIYSKANELKMVVAGMKDFEWAESESEKVGPDCRLYLQAEWDRREKQYPRIYSYIAAKPKWKISLQTHKYLNLP